jgi:hypothetical protein
MSEENNIEHRLKIAIDDASYLLKHLQSGGDMQVLTKHGDQPWSLWVNVKTALDLSDKICYDWVTSEEYNKSNS